MARSHGRILSGIWQDPDFRALPAEPQRMYLFLLSQPNLTHAGLLPLTVRRWASAALDLTPERVRAALAALEAARFVVVDGDAEELLIRTLVRNDGVWKQPKVMIRMGEDAREITSARLRAAFVTEMHRLPLDQLKPDTRAVVEGVVKGIIADFTPDPAGPSGGGPDSTHGTLPEGVSDTPSDTPRHGFFEAGSRSAEGSAGGAGTAAEDAEQAGSPPNGDPAESPQVNGPQQGYREGFPEGYAVPSARAHAHSPSPLPPKGVTTGAAPPSEQPTLDGAPAADADKPRGTPKKKRDSSKHKPADDLAAAFWERHKANTAQSFIAVRGIVRTALANGLDRDDVARALDQLAREGRAISGGTLQTALQQIRRPLRAVAGDYQPYSNPADQSAYENGF